MDVNYAQDDRPKKSDLHDEEINHRKLMEALKRFPINYVEPSNNAIIIDFQLCCFFSLWAIKQFFTVRSENVCVCVHCDQCEKTHRPD